MATNNRPSTLGELKASGYTPRSIKEELRANLITALRNGDNMFPGVLGFDDTVIPDLERAILSRHNILLLGLRGQAKTRIARQMTGLLDEYIPVVKGSELNDDPMAPLSRVAQDIIAEHGDDTPIEWVHRDHRYVEKLATPDVSVADLIGDVDPIKAATLKLPYSDERVIHFGLIPRSHRSIFVINELPDLQARIQVSLFNMGFIPGLKKGDLYKYYVHANDGRHLEKGDPYALFWEIPPRTASIVWELDYKWKDQKWLKARKQKKSHQTPFSVYEVHIGSWKKRDGGATSLSYRELADELVPYVKEMGFTHVEFMPVMEHPYFPSWGYQTTGYFAPTSRFGTPEDFMYLMDAFHQAGIGVLLDWVPSHFPADAHGLADFDGTHLYDHADPKLGFHPDWKSCIYNYGRNEVRSFLISNAIFWLDKFHADGLRVDAVASMLYLDYSREDGQWIPNVFGGNENLEAIAFLKEFNEVVYREFPDAITIAEESTAWSGVSRPVYDGGLGFGQKWMMGWMHDTLNYFKNDPIHRRYHHSEITFSTVYAFTENFMLPLSHDEVVHGKGSLMDRMPGDEWQRFANLRLLYGYMFTHPGTKLLFMGGGICANQRVEFGEWSGLVVARSWISPWYAKMD